jgi:hemerythrin
MGNSSSPDTVKHKNEHAVLIDLWKKLSLRILTGPQNKAILEILQFTVDWITNHILNTDQNILFSIKIILFIGFSPF